MGAPAYLLPVTGLCTRAWAHWQSLRLHVASLRPPFPLLLTQVEQIAGKLIGRTISRLDSSLLSDPSKRPLVPC